MSVPAAYLGIILIWSTTPLAIQWSSDEVGFLSGLLLFEYGQKAGKWVRDTMSG